MVDLLAPDGRPIGEQSWPPARHRHPPVRAARQPSLRRHNLALLVGELTVAGPLSRAELSRRIGMTKATVSSMVELLAAAGVVTELPGGRREREGRGRPGSPIGFGPRGPVAVGVEIAVDHLAACVVDLTGAVRHRTMSSVDNRLGPAEARLAGAAALCRTVLRRALADGCRVIGAGVALPGVVGADGTLWKAPNLPGWAGLRPAEQLAGLLAGPEPALQVVEVGNEANLAALGELWYGKRRDLRDFVLVSGEVGVGAGVVVGGRLFSGAGGAAGELGHVTVEPAGPLCGCGSRGCLEQYVGEEALLGAAGAASPRALLAKARAGDDAALSALEHAGRALGVAVSALLNVVDVPALLLGGLYAELAPYLLEALVSELATRVVSHAWAPTEVRVASLGAEAAMRGAAGVVLRLLLADPAAFLPELLVCG